MQWCNVSTFSLTSLETIVQPNAQYEKNGEVIYDRTDDM